MTIQKAVGTDAIERSIAYLLVYSGRENPTRTLSSEEEAEFGELMARVVARGARSDLRVVGHGGFAVGWSNIGTEFFAIVRNRLVALYDESGEPKVFEDVANIEGFLRAEIAALELEYEYFQARCREM